MLMDERYQVAETCTFSYTVSQFDASRAQLVLEVTENSRPIPLYRWPDGSVTNW